ncbi:hypothetical protein [Pseudogemmobacter humi]|uniref:Uncharacterized protein n=1 Tax=Pseudogemmobacter humi TaxID=2483812 RepID=A0A3P5WYR7_9RHOB|nr:hypothetical protein [Pseudogemmobacter humi]VDC28372.1 hypothetical protein XINFAN_02108 [Pseudogemmobacter humi]
MSDQIDLQRQLVLVLRALEAVLPYAEEAGIVTDYESAYDEWEDIVQAFYSSFVLLPLCDTTTRLSPHMFHRLGFEFEAKKYAIVAAYGQHTFAVFDFIKGANNRMLLVLRPVGAKSEVSDLLVLPEDCENFGVEALTAF